MVGVVVWRERRRGCEDAAHVCGGWVRLFGCARARLPDDADRVVCTFIDTGAYVRMGVPAERDGRDDDDVVPLPSHPRMVGGPVDMHAF